MDCNCFFCEENRFLLNNSIGLSDNSIIYENKYLFVTPDIAPIVLGHFLIVTKQHWNSYGNTNKEVFDALEEAKEYLKRNIFTDCPILFFEHGAVIEHTAGSCIDHAHMHAIPFDACIDIDGYIKKCEFINSTKVKANFTTLNHWAHSKQPYIYYEIEKDKYAYPVGRLPSQFFRAMIATYYRKQYNWKLLYKDEFSKNLFEDTLDLASGTKKYRKERD